MEKGCQGVTWGCPGGTEKSKRGIKEEVSEHFIQFIPSNLSDRSLQRGPGCYTEWIPFIWSILFNFVNSFSRCLYSLILPLSTDLTIYCCSVAKSCLTLCDPMDCSTPGFPCPSLSPGVCSNSCPLSRWCHPTILSSVSPCPSALNLSQHQGLSHWFGSSYQVVKVLEPQHQSFQWIFRIEYLGLTGLISLLSKGLSDPVIPKTRSWIHNSHCISFVLHHPCFHPIPLPFTVILATGLRFFEVLFYVVLNYLDYIPHLVSFGNFIACHVPVTLYILSHLIHNKPGQ